MSATTYGPDGGVQYTVGAPFLGQASLTITYPAGTGPGGISSQTISSVPTGNILTTSGSSLTVVNLLGASVFVVPPGITGTINMAANALGTTTIYVGGAATLSTAVTLVGSTTINVDGGSATFATTVADALGGTTVNLDNGGTFTNGAGLLSALSGATINFGGNGGTFLLCGGTDNSAAIDLSGVTLNNFDSAKDSIAFQDLAAPVTSYNVSAVSGGTQTITLYGSADQIVGTVTVTGTNFAAGTVTYGETGPLTLSGYDTANVTIDAGSATLCFLAGTHIATPCGQTPVEDLQIGDLVRTAQGDTAPIRFIGHRRINLRNHPHPHSVRPIRIQAGALAENIPHRDLLVSPDHALYLENALIPARDLVDGLHITQAPLTGIIDYFHLELDRHAILLAEGAGAESFVNVGHRGMFDNCNEPILLHPERWHGVREAKSCAPLVFKGEILTRIRQTLHAHIANSGYAAAEQTALALHLADKTLRPAQREGDRVTFHLPGGISHGIITSAVFVPAEFNPASPDRRRLGIAITGISINDIQVALHDILNPADLHPSSAQEHATWTRGDVRITLPPDARTLTLTIVGWPQVWVREEKEEKSSFCEQKEAKKL